MADEEDLADAPRVVGVLSALLERVVERNDAVADELTAGTASAASSLAPPSAFRATARPDISVRSYMARIARFAGCSPACYVVAYAYLDRLLRRGRGALGAVDSYSVHRLLITAVLAAVKFMDDVCYNNAYFARVGGISLVEMNYLEVDFLFAVGFDLIVSPETFGHYCAVLRAEMLYLELEGPPPAAAGPRLHSCCLSEDDGSSSSSQQQKTTGTEVASKQATHVCVRVQYRRGLLESKHEVRAVGITYACDRFAI